MKTELKELIEAKISECKAEIITNQMMRQFCKKKMNNNSLGSDERREAKDSLEIWEHFVNREEGFVELLNQILKED